MECRELHAFVAVLEEGGITAAARRLHLSQSTLSHAHNVAKRLLGKPAELPIYRVFLTVPQGLPGITGPLNEQRRNALVREVTELVLTAEGVTDIEAHTQRVWCMLREQSEGFWGATGRILRMTDWDALAQAGETAAGRGHLTFAE